MSNVYVTGATGFLGRNLGPFLDARGHGRIWSVGRRGRDFTYESFMDARDLSGTLVHMAGLAHDLKRSADGEAYRTANVELTRRLFGRFLKSDLELMIFVSSVKALADSANSPLTELAEPHPSSVYGETKLAAERILESESIPPGKRIVILRPAMVHGPGNKGNLNLLASLVARGIPYPLAAFENSRSFLSVGNFCFVVDQIISGALVSGSYNVADDHSLSTNAVVRLLGEEMNSKVRMWRLPKLLVGSLARGGDMFGAPFNSDALSKLTGDFLVSNALLKRGLQIDRLPIHAEEGLRLTARALVAE